MRALLVQEKYPILRPAASKSLLECHLPDHHSSTRSQLAVRDPLAVIVLSATVRGDVLQFVLILLRIATEPRLHHRHCKPNAITQQPNFRFGLEMFLPAPTTIPQSECMLPTSGWSEMPTSASSPLRTCARYAGRASASALSWRSRLSADVVGSWDDPASSGMIDVST